MLPTYNQYVPARFGGRADLTCHHVYGGNPNLATPGDSLPVLFNFSARVKSLIKEVALVSGSVAKS